MIVFRNWSKISVEVVFKNCLWFLLSEEFLFPKRSIQDNDGFNF